MEPIDAQAIRSVVATFYSVFDNRGGRRANFERLREIFAPGAKIVRVGAGTTGSWTVDEFLEPRVALLTDGRLVDFHEWEVKGSNVGAGSIATRWSSYAKAWKSNGVEVRGSGQKLIQLHRADAGWVIVSILWEELDTRPLGAGA